MSSRIKTDAKHVFDCFLEIVAPQNEVLYTYLHLLPALKNVLPERPALDLAVLPSQLQGQGGGETSICSPVHLPLPHHCHSCAALLLRPHQLGGSVDFWILQVCTQLRDCPLLSLLPSLARSLLQTAEPVRGASHCNRTRRLAHLLPLRSAPG